MIIDFERFMEAIHKSGLSSKAISEVENAIIESRGLAEDHPVAGGIYETPDGIHIHCYATRGAGNLRLRYLGSEIGSGFNRLAAHSELNRRRAKYVGMLDK